MAITVNTLSYEADPAINKDRIPYVGPSNSFDTKDTFTLGRAAAKPSGTDPGVARAYIKRTKDVVIGGLKKSIIVNVEVSVPVGALAADVESAVDDVGDFMITASGKNLATKHDLTV